MGLLSKGVITTSAALGLALFSQAPEFAQQYRQRLGGALEELRTVVSDFDRDADASSMTREQALEQMQAAGERFTRDRGASMARTVERYDTLSGQQMAMETAQPIARPLLVLRNPDPRVIEGAWGIYEPALPLNLPGAFFVHNEADEDYSRQLVSEARVLGDKLKPEWIKRQRDNHFLDCEALAAAAAYSLNVQSIPEGVERSARSDKKTTAGDREAEAMPAARSPKSENSRSIRERFRSMGARSRR